MRNVIISTILLTLFSSGILANDKIFTKEYKLNGKIAVLEVEAVPSGSDVFLNSGTRKNISYNTPGENLFPKMFVKKGSYSVTWINYKKNDVKLNFYDSSSDYGRTLVSDKFEFISSDTAIIFNMGRPEFILFRAIKGEDNEDIFVHNIDSGRTGRITSTSGNENKIIIENSELNGRNTFTLITNTLENEYTYTINIDDLSARLADKKEILRGQKSSKASRSGSG